MPYYIQKYYTAYLVTEEDVDVIARISGFDSNMLRHNLNWVVLVDYTKYYPKFSIIPRRVFERDSVGSDINFSKPVTM